jgi:hypothetical protein
MSLHHDDSATWQAICQAACRDRAPLASCMRTVTKIPGRKPGGPAVHAELLFDMWIDLACETIPPAGALCCRPRRLGPVQDGRFAGPSLRGAVRSGREEAHSLWPAGERTPDVGLALDTDDGHCIVMAYRGLAWISPQMWQRIGHTMPHDPAAAYFRTTPLFVTRSAQYGWLNRLVAVSIGQWVPPRLVYTVYTLPSIGDDAR